MDRGPGLLVEDRNARPKVVPRLRLLLELEPAHRVFFRNLADLVLFRPTPRIVTTCRPAPFWRDVFVYSGLPWWGFLESVLWHMLAVIAVWSLTQGLRTQERVLPRTNLSRAYVSYYTPYPSFPARKSGGPRVRPRAKERTGSTHASVDRVAAERGRSIIRPPQIKLTAPARPNIVASSPALPAIPLSATGRSRLTIPVGPTSIVAPSPDVRGAVARRAGLPQASVVGPAPGAEGVFSGRRAAMTAPNAGVVAPAPSVQGAIRKIGDINIGHAEVVEPAPRLPMQEQRALSAMAGSGTALGRPGMLVVPPPPSVQSSGTLGGGRVSSLTGAGVQAVPPAPSVQGMGNSAPGARVSPLSRAGPQVVPPAPSIQPVGNATAGGRVSQLAGAGLQAVPPAPSVQGAGGSAASGRMNSMSGGVGPEVVPPAPAIPGAGNYSGRGSSLSSAGMQAAPPTPSAQGNSTAGGAPGVAAGTGGQDAAAPSAQEPGSSTAGPSLVQSGSDSGAGGSSTAGDTAAQSAGESDNSGGPATQELPVRVIGLALALPGSSYFSNYEVFIAEKVTGKQKSQLIKLVYMSLPYQRRLSEYDLNNARVYKLRVTRDRACDETLLQMIGSQANLSQAVSQYFSDPAFSSVDRNRRLACYRTTADDYRKALSRGR